ncbi:DUF1998 domain-containing protein [Patulibacter brassicae]|uniref:DUF1998 domain-containing protein n=1 Tax=Patulibacter brassicae TaxID=1705717 RepID=A0ABU4VMB2_9ACTN|nr:DUF1998 domain-containing protein [Patulibacter brassicae]MDX8152086.1 DUF1998 domain-containing protein [Patulibacter brassicae]
MERTIRLSQTVAPFGVGSIYDLRGESLATVDTSRWGGMGERLELDRLAKDLGVQGFRSAPARADQFSTKGARLTFVRFPRWLFCPVCRRMTMWKSEFEVPGEPARCGFCTRTPKPELVPMRFVLTCPDGHLGDVQWDRFAHSRAEGLEQRQCKSRDLTFTTKPGAGTGLDASWVTCRSCKAGRSLQGITKKGAAVSMGLLCPGKQPWQYLPADAPQCKQEAIVLQRGASNLYFSDIRSAIDIPPDSDFDVFSDVARKVTATPGFEMLMSTDPDDDLMVEMLVTRLSKEHDVPEADILRLVAGAKAEISGAPATAVALTGDLRRDEWNALIADRGQQDERNRFLTRHEQLRPDGELSRAEQLLVDAFGPVVLVTRLREVRALTGFRRYQTDGPKLPPQLDAQQIDWLPAIEVYGEGLFLRLNEDALQKWEAQDEVIRRVRVLEERRPDSLVGDRLKAASPRFVLVHTLAHLLIRRLSFESGYSAASLRERVYCAEAGGSDAPYAGVLIYTAAGDAEGTLGGLVRQGRPPRMLHTLLATLEEAAWCSADPLCIDARAQGFQGLNRGACHACSLVAETSCEYSNSFLDRGVLVDREVGFFRDALAAALEDSGRTASVS